MANLNNTLRNGLIDYLLRAQPLTQPTVLSHILCTTTPDETDTGQLSSSPGPGVEVTNVGTGYVRQDLAAGAGNYDAPVGGVSANAVEISYPQATASYTTVNGLAVGDNTTYDSGALYYQGDLVNPRLVDTDDILTFPIGNITYTWT